MIESKIIAHTLVYLIKKENFTPKKVSIRTNREKRQVENILYEKKLKCSFKFEGTEDISGHYTFKTKRPQKRLTVEAKGGTVHYSFYTMLGQFLTQKKSSSSYHWFAFAMPITWREKVKNYLLEAGEIKPIIKDIIKNYTKNGQGLRFYFVKKNGDVVRETWKQTLRINKNDFNNKAS